MRRTRVSKICEFPKRNGVFLRKLPKKDLARKPNLKKAFFSESFTMLKMRVSRTFFASISKSKGSKTQNMGKRAQF